MKKYKYSFFDRVLFYLSYFFYKILTIYEVKKPRLTLFFLDFFYSFANLIYLLRKDEKIIYFFYKVVNINYIETIFGKFFVRKNTIDSIVASPSFERRDVNFLIKKISEEIFNQKKVVFLDIGADFGYYSILLANIFNKNDLLKIYGFEPISANNQLFKKNVYLNNAKNIEIIPLAVYNKDDVEISISVEEMATGSNSISLKPECNIESVKTTTIDSFLSKNCADFDTIFIKVDVEGFETEVMLGAEKLLKSGKIIYLMVEDFVDDRIIDYLESSEFTFISKFNNYNSWWILKR